MKMNSLRKILIGCLALVSVGCSQVAATNAPETAVPPPAEATAMTQTTPMETSPSLPIPSIPGLPALIEKAKADLSQRSSVPVTQINVLEAREVFWPDASLGCPQPGTAYDQVEVPGYLILLQANGNEFEYHANIHNYVFYCENPTPSVLDTPAGGPPR
jgi:hypothetical protein